MRARDRSSPLAIAAIAEAATGIALLLSPSTVVRLLFGAAISGAGIVICRIGGLGLIALGVACWPGTKTRALAGMLTYSTFVALYLIYVGFVGTWGGTLLWPAVVFHVVLTVLLMREWRHEPSVPTC